LDQVAAAVGVNSSTLTVISDLMNPNNRTVVVQFPDANTGGAALDLNTTVRGDIGILAAVPYAGSAVTSAPTEDEPWYGTQRNLIIGGCVLGAVVVLAIATVVFLVRRAGATGRLRQVRDPDYLAMKEAFGEMSEYNTPMVPQQETIRIRRVEEW
jgi:hypothetical protein